MIEYSIQENLLTGKPGDCRAIAHSAAKLDELAVIERILTRGTTITRADLQCCFTIYKEVIAEALQQGCSLNLPLCNTSFSISGVFNGKKDTYDPKRHKLNIKITKGTLLREAEKRVKLAKTNPQNKFQILEVRDSVTGQVNITTSRDGIIEVIGNNLRIDGDNPECGLWLIDKDGKETKADSFIMNKPSNLIAKVPELTPGIYNVKVVTQYTGSNATLNKPRKIVYNEPITISPNTSKP